jgi:triosephosphate isomerase
MVIFNLKTYPQATGIHLDDYLLDIHSVVTEMPHLKNSIFVAPSLPDLFWAQRNFPELNFCAQHVDNVDAGKSTGKIPADILKDMNINYVFVNHPENKENNVKAKIKALKSKRFKIIFFAQSVQEVEKIAKLNPDIIVFESETKNIKDNIQKKLKEIKFSGLLFYGGGIKTYDDVVKVKSLGFNGIAMASSLVKSSNPKETILAILEAF